MQQVQAICPPDALSLLHMLWDLPTHHDALAGSFLRWALQPTMTPKQLLSHTGTSSRSSLLLVCPLQPTAHALKSYSPLQPTTTYCPPQSEAHTLSDCIWTQSTAHALSQLSVYGVSASVYCACALPLLRMLSSVYCACALVHSVLRRRALLVPLHSLLATHARAPTHPPTWVLIGSTSVANPPMGKYCGQAPL